MAGGGATISDRCGRRGMVARAIRGEVGGGGGGGGGGGRSCIAQQRARTAPHGGRERGAGGGGAGGGGGPGGEGRGGVGRPRAGGGGGGGGGGGAGGRWGGKKELGREAGRRLIDLIAGKEFRGVRRIPCTLVIRDRAAPGAARRATRQEASDGASGAFAREEAGRSGGGVDTRGRFNRRSTSGTSPSPARSGSERLDTVLTRTIPPEPARAARKNGILESLDLPKPPPPLRIPIRAHGLTTQVFWDLGCR